MTLRNTPKPALVLGLAGLLPFWGLAISMLMIDPEMKVGVVRAEIGFGAVILSFLGGIHWGLAVMNKQSADWSRLGWGVTPSLLGWGALFLPPVWGLTLLLCGFVAAAVIDYRTFTDDKATQWFASLRTVLSIGAISALLFTLVIGNRF